MNFTFLHAADLHLGSPLAGLALKDETVAARVAAASREAFSDLVSRAIEEKVAFVVIAGDVYDGEWKDTAIGLFFNRELARLARADIPVLLLRGNHDAESVVTKAIRLPDTVVEFSTRRPETHRIEALRVALHGRGFPTREVAENYALSYPAPVPGWFNIGVLHTSLDGRPGHAPYAPCTVADLATRGYQYWALGHVHAFEVVAEDPHIVFPGNLQGRSIRECGAKGAVFVDVADGAVAGLRRVVTDRVRWALVDVDLDGLTEETDAYTAVEAAVRPFAKDAEGRLVALRIRLHGTTALHRRLAADPARVRDEVEAAAQRAAEDVWIETLRFETNEPEVGADPAIEAIDLAALLAGLEQDGELRRAAAEEIGRIQAKIPATGEADGFDLAAGLDDAMAQARALVLGRAGAPGS